MTLILTDIDECSEMPQQCSFNADCRNIPGSYECSCNTGYVGDGVDCSGTSSIVVEKLYEN